MKNVTSDIDADCNLKSLGDEKINLELVRFELLSLQRLYLSSCDISSSYCCINIHSCCIMGMQEYDEDSIKDDKYKV